MANKKAIPLADHIKKKHGGNKAAFARANNMFPQSVSRWINKEYFLIDGQLYGKVREEKIN